METKIKWTHLALHVSNLDESVKFYTEFTGLKKIHDRFDEETQMHVAWLSDCPKERENEFVLVLIEGVPEQFENVLLQSPIGPLSHLGFSVATRSDVDRIADRGKQQGILTSGPVYLNEVVGYICTLKDPDGHQIEFSYGQVLG